MSIKAISWVWQNSKQKGGALLLELAIADFADDEGRAWPAIATLAVKARMTPRNVNLVIEKKLKPAGLLIKQNAGPHQTNLFQLPVHGGEKISPLKDFQDEARFLEPLKPASANPSLNRHNKNKSGTKVPCVSLASGFKNSPQPHQERSIKLTRAGGRAVPPELQLTISKVVARINELAQTHYLDDRPDALKHLISRLQEGRTESECLAVVDGRHSAWRESQMMEYFRPSTLFAAVHFDDYLQQAQRTNGNGRSISVQPKDIGNGLVEVEGLKMTTKDYERKYGSRG